MATLPAAQTPRSSDSPQFRLPAVQTPRSSDSPLFRLPAVETSCSSGSSQVKGIASDENQKSPAREETMMLNRWWVNANSDASASTVEPNRPRNVGKTAANSMGPSDLCKSGVDHQRQDSQKIFPRRDHLCAAAGDAVEHSPQ